MASFKDFIRGKAGKHDPSKSKTCSVCGNLNKLDARFCSSCGNEFRTISEIFDGFISYRRESGSDLASLIKIQLESRFHKQIFLDVKELQVGRFDEKLLQNIERTPNFIIILSRSSLDRCIDKSDWLKREIMHAIEKGCNIITVLTEGFTFPSEKIWSMLPEEMRLLSSLNGVIYSHIHQDEAIRKIASYMKSEAELERRESAVSKPHESSKTHNIEHDKDISPQAGVPKITSHLKEKKTIHTTLGAIRFQVLSPESVSLKSNKASFGEIIFQPVISDHEQGRTHSASLGKIHVEFTN